jgi:SAM-dependent methyltransferase
MPYAARDRQELIKRSNLDPGSRVLDLGGMLSDELPSAVSGITTSRHNTDAVLIRPENLPFKDSVFNAVISYHYFDLVSSDAIGIALKEVARVLGHGAIFSFMVLLWAPQNEAQRSSLFFNELLKGTGALYSHDFEIVSRQLSSSGFCDITVETIKRDIIIPRDFTRSHLLMLGNLIKKENEQGGFGIKAPARLYFEQVKVYGEAMLPALHFIARKAL